MYTLTLFKYCEVSSVIVRLCKTFATTNTNSFLPIKKLPVPSLSKSLQKYLIAIKPFTKSDQFDETCKIVNEFGRRPDGVGQKLQSLLKKRAVERTNWLSDWWLSSAYLSERSSVISSSGGILFPDDNSLSNTLDDQILHAAKLIAGMLDYKKTIDMETLSQDFMGADPLDMCQYFNLFSNCRIPGSASDSLFKRSKHSDSRHIIVFYKGQMTSIDVYEPLPSGADQRSLTPLPLDSIIQLLSRCTSRVETSPNCSVGILTAADRDTWATAYSNLLHHDSAHHTKYFDIINSSIFTVHLDTKNVRFPLSQNQLSSETLQMLHGGGTSFNSSNRWFDKTFQLIVGKSGVSGVTFEHSPGDGTPISALFDHTVEFYNNVKASTTTSASGKRLLDVSSSSINTFEWNIPESVQSLISTSKRQMNDLVNDIDLAVDFFRDFGSDHLKALHMSPDAFIQAAVQSTYYRLYRKACATYESASTRKFIEGRTDTVRSCTSDTLSLSKSLIQDPKNFKKNFQLLHNVEATHRKLVFEAINGQAFDRHLLGLKLISIEAGMKMPDIFEDPSYRTANHFLLSTSQVSCETDVVYSFKAVTPDGYGVCYNPKGSKLIVAISSHRTCDKTDSKLFLRELFKTFRELELILLSCEMK